MPDNAMTLEQVQSALDEQIAHYRANADDMTTRQAREYQVRIHELQLRRSVLLSEGAEVCEDCGGTPMGMLKTAAELDEFGIVKYGAVYEVGGCGCKPVPNGRGNLIMPAARGSTPAEAVAAWNANRLVQKRAGEPAAKKV